MPSFIFSDYGDFLRTGANTGDEDDKDLNRVNFNMEIFKAFTKGYLEGTLVPYPIEIENLPYAAALFRICNVRFWLITLTETLTINQISRTQPCTRTKAQFKLLQKCRRAHSGDDSIYQGMFS